MGEMELIGFLFGHFVGMQGLGNAEAGAAAGCAGDADCCAAAGCAGGVAGC